MARPNQAQLDLASLRHNLGIARRLAGPARVMAVVKANAYGHGATTIARALEPGVDALAVACIEEALELREAGVTCPVLLLEGVFESHELITAVEQGFWLTIDNECQLAWLEQARLPAPAICWLKVDTGMHRLGAPVSQAQQFYERLRASKNCSDELVVYTHFASADDLDSPQTSAQLALFDTVTQSMDALRSAANSPGLLGWPAARYDWVRPGYMLYGNSPMKTPHVNAADLQPVMTLTSAVISVRDVPTGESVGYSATWRAERPSRIATVTVGYGDGYPRLTANGTPVLVNGQRALLAGRVSMDMITVDVSDLRDVQVGDPVVLWGKGLPLSEVAACAGTIGYELTTRMPMRTPRVVISH